MKCKRLISGLLAGAMVMAVCTCGSLAAGPMPGGPPDGGMPAADPVPAREGPYSMELSDYASEWKYFPEAGCYGLENIVYCTNPTNPGLQAMNIYVPAAYMNADGTVNSAGTVGQYGAQTAPIIYANGVAGYMEAAPNAIGDFNPFVRNSIEDFLARGYVYVSVGSRGRGTQAGDGSYTGKSPEGLVDLKAGVRFLKYNDAVLAGSSERIISHGVSAGGAMSSLLGSTGNSVSYLPWLEAMGAVMTATDDIYAAQCYCPITDLEHADMAYEWQYVTDTSYDGFMSGGGDLTPFQQDLSRLLAAEYVNYYNSLGLVDAAGSPLTLNADGRSGSGYDYVMSQLESAAAVYLEKLASGAVSAEYTVEEYLARNAAWLSYENGSASITSLDDFVAGCLGRMKACTAFDNLDCAEAENEEMGTASVNAMHFNPAMAGLIAQLKDSHPEDYAKYYEGYAAVAGDMNLAERVYLINPMNYIGTSEACDTAPFFRIRVGTADGHTAFTVSMNLALKLAAAENTAVDYAMVWNEPHGDADYTGELFAWVDRIWTAPAAAESPAAPEAPAVPGTPSAPGASSTYVVQKGDSLWSIAARLLGSGTRWGEIYEANRTVIRDPAQIQVGMVLTIPQQ